MMALLRPCLRPIATRVGATVPWPLAARTMASKEPTAVQITVTGTDRPGVVSQVCERLGGMGATMLDVEDLVTHDKVALQIIAQLPEQRGTSIVRDMLKLEHDLSLNCSFDLVDLDNLATLRHKRGYKQYSITILADTIGFDMLGAVSGAAKDNHFNIVKIERLSPLASFATRDEISVVEMILEGNDQVIDSKALRKSLVPIQKAMGCDLAVQREGLKKRQKRMVVMDMDSTLIQQEVIDEIARIHGVYDKVAEVTHRAMNGELDFDESLIERCRQLKGAPASVFDDVYEIIELTPGADDFVRVLQSLGYKVAVLSGGFTQVVDKVKLDLNLDFAFANTLEVGPDGCLTGEVVGSIVNRERKRDLLLTMASAVGIRPDQCIAVGDGANDLSMLRAAGLGIAFNAKPNVQDQAEFTLNRSRLDTVLYLLGVRPKDAPEWLASTKPVDWKTQRKPRLSQAGAKQK